MQVTEENLKIVAGYLQSTLDARPEVRIAAEKYLNDCMKQPGFSLLLLKLFTVSDSSIHQSAAILFKNMIKKHWVVDPEVEENPVELSQNDKQEIKKVIVDLMLNSYDLVKKQMAASLTLISETDFPRQWPELLPELVNRLNTNDFQVVNGILKSAHSIFKRYRHQAKSPETLMELKYILDTFQQTFLNVFQKTINFISQHQTNPEALKTLFTSLVLLLKIFYSLNCIDLPEFFEDHMEEFMTLFQNLLKYETNYSQLNDSNDEYKPGLLHQVQSWICQIISLYVSKYEEEFEKYLSMFATNVWSLLIKTGNEPKFDKLVTSGIGFLTSISTSVYHSLFQAPATIKELIEKIIIPNLRLREIDLEMFEDNPIDYIRSDIEGSDAETRRRVATVFIKGLRKYYEEPVTKVCESFISNLLQDYANNPIANWLSKDVAIYLITALAIRSQTSAQGTTNVSNFVPIREFYLSQILPELMNTNPPALVLKADALKFVWTFRLQLSVDDFVQIFPCFISALQSPNFVVHSYAASCIDKILTLRDPTTSTPKFTREHLRPFLLQIISCCTKILSLPQSKENEYVMRGIMRIVSVGQDDIGMSSVSLMQTLSQILDTVSANPSNPSFNHYLFESIAAILKSIGQKSAEVRNSCEQFLIPVFSKILTLDVQEFVPYVFQIFSLLIETSPTPLNPFYMSFFPNLLLGVMWERRANVPALVRLLQAYFFKAGSQIVANQQLEPVLGIFSKLILSKVLDHEGFFLLEALVQYLEVKDLNPYVQKIFINIFSRLHNNKTPKFVKSFNSFLNLFIGKHGPNYVLSQIEAIQANLFQSVWNSLLEPYLPRLVAPIDRKMAVISLTKLLTESSLMLSPPYQSIWLKALIIAIQLSEGKVDQNANDEFELDNEVEESGFSPAFSQLIHGVRIDNDPFPQVAHPPTFLALQLSQASKANPGFISGQVQLLPASEKNALFKYFQIAQIPEPYF